MTTDRDKTRDQLIAELATLRRLLSDMEASSLPAAAGGRPVDAERIFLTALMASVPDSIYFKDRESRFVMVNRALSDRFGLSDPSEAVGKTDADFFSGMHASEARQDELEVMRTGLPLVGKEEKETMPDGASRWVSTTKLPLYDRAGRVIGTFGVSRDVTEPRLAADALRLREEELRRHKDHLEDLVGERTRELQEANEHLQREVHERRRAEAALRLSESRYRQVLAAAPTYVYTVRVQDGRPVSSDHGSGCLAVTGYSSDEFAAAPDLWVAIVHPDDREKVLAPLRAEGTGDPKPIEHRIVRRDGTIRWVRNAIVPRAGEAGAVACYDGLAEDITDRKLSEEALRESERLKAIGSLASGVAHNFSNAMALVGGSAFLVMENVLPGTIAHREAQRILDAVNHASDLTRRLMGVASACMSDGDTVIESVSLGQVLKDTVELLGPTFADQKCSIQVRNAARMPCVYANAGQLLSTLMSLFANAAEAMPHGGVVTVWCSEKRITSPSQRRNPKGDASVYVGLHLRDTGCGIEEKILDRIFEPFFTTKHTPSSFGLGLTVAQNLVEGWGGWIEVASKAGEGSTFTLYMARAKAAPRLRAGTAPSLRDRGILLADDDRELVEQLRRDLQAEGARVYAATTVEEAKALYDANAERIAVSVVDLVMPGGAGKELLEHIRGRDPNAKTVVLSGFCRDYVRHRLGPWGWGFVQKPVAREAFFDALTQAVFGRKSRA